MCKITSNHRKSPLKRKSTEISLSRRHFFTRTELRTAIAHDHTYCKPPDPADPLCNNTLLSNVSPTESVLLEPEKPLLQKFSIECSFNDDAAIRFYTFFELYAQLMILFNFLGDSVNHLIYSGSSSDANYSRTKTRRALSPKNEFFLTLCRLRFNLMEDDLAYRFKISQPTVSRIFTTWVNFLYYKLKEIPIWPSREQVQLMMPEEFLCLYPNTRIIIDATEIFIQRPSDPSAQQVTFSSYKNSNTAKVLAGITPSGAFSFISDMYGGSILDRELFIASGLINKLEPGDAVMADKGFNIYDILESHGIMLNIPPRKNNDELSCRELIETRRIASLRIHVERAFKRVKDFRILDSIPINMAGLSSELFYVCAMLTNFRKPLVLKKL